MKKFNLISFIILTLSFLLFDFGICGTKTQRVKDIVTSTKKKIKEAPKKTKELYKEELKEIAKEEDQPSFKEKVEAGFGVLKWKRREERRDNKKAQEEKVSEELSKNGNREGLELETKRIREVDESGPIKLSPLELPKDTNDVIKKSMEEDVGKLKLNEINKELNKLNAVVDKTEIQKVREGLLKARKKSLEDEGEKKVAGRRAALEEEINKTEKELNDVKDTLKKIGNELTDSIKKREELINKEKEKNLDLEVVEDALKKANPGVKIQLNQLKTKLIKDLEEISNQLKKAEEDVAEKEKIVKNEIQKVKNIAGRIYKVQADSENVKRTENLDLIKTALSNNDIRSFAEAGRNLQTLQRDLEVANEKVKGTQNVFDKLKEDDVEEEKEETRKAKVELNNAQKDLELIDKKVKEAQESYDESKNQITDILKESEIKEDILFGAIPPTKETQENREKSFSQRYEKAIIIGSGLAKFGGLALAGATTIGGGVAIISAATSGSDEEEIIFEEEGEAEEEAAEEKEGEEVEEVAAEEGTKVETVEEVMNETSEPYKFEEYDFDAFYKEFTAS